MARRNCLLLRLALSDSGMFPGVFRYPAPTPPFAGRPCCSLCRDGDLAAGVMFQHVRDGARCLAERVGLVDDNPDLAGFEEPDEGIQVFPVRGDAGQGEPASAGCHRSALPGPLR